MVVFPCSRTADGGGVVLCDLHIFPFIASSAKAVALPGVSGKRSAAVTSYLPTTQKGSSCQTPTGIYKIVYCRANGGEMIKRGISVVPQRFWGEKKSVITHLFKSSNHNVSV